MADVGFAGQVVLALGTIAGAYFAAGAGKATAKTTAKAAIEAKQTLDVTQHEIDISKQRTDFIDRVTADNAQLSARLDAVNVRVDELHSELMKTRKEVADNYKRIQEQDWQIQNLKEREKMLQEDHQHELTRLNDERVDLIKKLNDANARSDYLSRQLARCQCGQNGQGSIEIGNAETVNVEVKTP